MSFNIILENGTKDSVLKSGDEENIFNCGQVKSIEFENGAFKFKSRNGKIYSTALTHLEERDTKLTLQSTGSMFGLAASDPIGLTKSAFASQLFTS